MDNVALCICSCDSYSDIWPIFFQFMKKNWADCDLPIYLNTESKKFSCPDFDVTVVNNNSTSDTWSERLIKTLKSIKEEYVILLLDDFFILDKVSNKKIAQSANVLKENSDIACLNFCNMDKDEGENIKKEFGLFKQRSITRAYWLNFLPSMWNKSALIKLLSPYENPWQAEWFGTLRAKLYKWKHYTLSDCEAPIIKYDIRITVGYGLCQGKWTYPTKELFEKEGIDVDMSVRGFCDPGLISHAVEYPKMTLRHRLEYFIFGGINESDMDCEKGIFYRMRIGQQLKLSLTHPKYFLKILGKKFSVLFNTNRGRVIDTQTGKFVE